MAKQGKKTKRELQDKAFELFDAKGYDNVTVDEICQELGLTKGAFYYYFRSKSDLLLKTYRNTEGDLLTFYNKHLHHSANEQLKAIFNWYLSYFKSDDFQNLTTLPQGQTEGYQKSYPLTHTTQRVVFQNIIDKGIQNGDFKPTMPSAELANFIYIYLMGLSSLWNYYKKNLDIEKELSDFYNKVLLPMLNPNK